MTSAFPAKIHPRKIEVKDDNGIFLQYLWLEKQMPSEFLEDPSRNPIGNADGFS